MKKIDFSENGKSWEQYSSAPITSLKTADELFYGLGSSASFFAKSTDLKNWKIYNAPIGNYNVSIVKQYSNLEHSYGVDIAYGNGIWVYVVFLTNDYWTQTTQVLAYNEQTNSWDVSLNVTRNKSTFLIF